MVVQLEARILGEVGVVAPAAPASLGGPTPRALFALLALDAGRVVSRDRLVDGLWGARPPPNPEANIQTHVSRLRRSLSRLGAGDLIVTRTPGYCLDLAGRVDLHRFERAADAGRAALADGDPDLAAEQLREALACWTGPPLGGVEEFPFAAPVVARLIEARLSITEDLYDALLATGRSAPLVAELRHATDEHPLRERLRGQLVLALYRGGRQADALAELRRFTALLDDELGLEPSPALRELERSILTHEVAEPTHAPPRPGSPAAAPSPPPPPPPAWPAAVLNSTALDSFVGRVAELDVIERRLEDDAVRLISLTGPGGSGKTRLAEEIARRWTSRAAGPAVVARLDSLADPDLLMSAVAGALGLGATTDVESVAHALGDQRVLLVLDNLEHLLAGVEVIAELLERTSAMTVLATSRVSLHLPGEHEITVPPLRLPPAGATGDRAVSEATQLFIDRAHARLGTFDPDDATMTAICTLVRLLDGLPLAIELAAARIKVLPPIAMVERMREPLDLVSDPGRRRPGRQQTLRATVRWSVDLLDHDLRLALARLSVFSGRFDLADADAVVGGDRGIDALAAVEALTDHSLIHQAWTTDGVVFSMLRTIRAYAAELLAADPEERVAAQNRRDAHLAAMVGHHGLRVPLVLDQTSARWIRRHLDDLRAVLEEAWQRKDAGLVVELAAGLAYSWALVVAPGGHVWLRRALEMAETEGATPSQRALLHIALATLCTFGGPYDQAKVHARAALDAVDAGAPPALATHAHNVLGLVASYDGRWEDADQHASAAHALSAQFPDADLPAVMTMNYRTDLLMTRGEWEAAARTAQEVLDVLAARTPDLAGEHGDIATGNLSVSLLVLGDLAGARARLWQLAERMAERPVRLSGAVVLLGFAALAVAAGRHRDAVRLLGGVQGAVATDQVGFGRPEQGVLEATMTSIRANLDPAEVAALLAEGKAMTTLDLIAVMAGVPAG